MKKRGNLVFRFPAGGKEDIFPPVLFSPHTCGIVCCRGDFSSSFRLRMWWLLDFDSPFPSMKTAAVKRLQKQSRGKKSESILTLPLLPLSHNLSLPRGRKERENGTGFIAWEEGETESH